MTFNPSYDSSTIFFANEIIEWLKYPPEGINIKSIFQAMRDLNFLSNNNDFEKSLLSILADLNRLKFYYIKKGNFYNFENIETGDTSLGAFLIKTLFGISSLIKIIEGICLGDKIFYIPKFFGTQHKLEYIGDNFIKFDTENLWNVLKLNGEEEEKYEKWISKGILSENYYIQEKIDNFIKDSLCQPILNLCGWLYDASIGSGTPITNDSIMPYNNWVTGFSWQELKDRIAASPAHLTQNDFVLLKRMQGYLINGILYEIISRIAEIDYVKNDVRGPFLFSFNLINNLNDKEIFLEILNYAIGTIRDISLKENTIKLDKINKKNLIFNLVLNIAKDVNDIIPTAYRLRKKLKPLREYISLKGRDFIFNKNFENLLIRLKLKETIKYNGLPVSGAKVKIPIPGEYLSLLYKPIYLGKKKYLNSIIFVTENLKYVCSISERLQKLAGY